MMTTAADRKCTSSLADTTARTRVADWLATHIDAQHVHIADAELLTGSARGATHRAAKHRADAEMGL